MTKRALMNEKFKILFVCTGNTCRSPMAEGAMNVLLDRERSGHFIVQSCGTSAASDYPATMYAIEAARLWEYDLSEHRSQPLTEELLKSSDLILAMSPEHLRRLLKLSPEVAPKAFLFKNFPGSETDGEPVEDPIGQPLDRYNETFLEIGEYLGKYLPEIVKRIDVHQDEKK